MNVMNKQMCTGYFWWFSVTV